MNKGGTFNIKTIVDLLKSRNKKAQVGLNIATAFMITLLTLGLIAFIIIIVMGSLSTTSILPTGSLQKNQTEWIFANITAGITSFFSSSVAWFALLGVVIIILIASIVIIAVRRFGGGGGGNL